MTYIPKTLDTLKAMLNWPEHIQERKTCGCPSCMIGAEARDIVRDLIGNILANRKIVEDLAALRDTWKDQACEIAQSNLDHIHRNKKLADALKWTAVQWANTYGIDKITTPCGCTPKTQWDPETLCPMHEALKLMEGT